MADDDDDVRGEAGSRDLFGPTGPRRSNFTPAPTDADSLEAANSVFGDDAIAEAMAAELARVASGPIPIQRPAATAPAPAPVPVSAPVIVEAPAPAEAAAPAEEPAPVEEPAAVSEPTPTVAPAAPPTPVEAPASDAAPAEPETVSMFAPPAVVPQTEPSSFFAPPAEPEPAEPEPAEPEPVESEPVEPEPVEREAVASAPAAEIAAPQEPPTWTEPARDEIPAWAPQPVADVAPATPQQPPAWEPFTPATPAAETTVDFGTPPQALPDAQPEPVAESAPEPNTTPSVNYIPSAPAPPEGPPDWATPLFAPPPPVAHDDTVPGSVDPFAPTEPPFAPSSGPFPPPSEVDEAAKAAPYTTDSDALRALYRGAPAPTVPAADAPPPPGYVQPAEPLQQQETAAPAFAPASPVFPTEAVAPAVFYAPAPVGEPEPQPVAEPQPVSEPEQVSEPEPVAEPEPLAEPEATGSSEPASLYAQPVATVDSIEEIQSKLHLREQEAREFAVWESSMRAIGTPEALAEVARARSELESVAAQAPPAHEPVSDAPPVPEEPAAYVAPVPEEPAAYVPPAQEEPAAYVPPVPEQPAYVAPPQEAVAFLPPPVEEPAAELAPPVEDDAVAWLTAAASEPAAPAAPAAPVDEPAAWLPAPVDQVAAPPAPAEEPVAWLPAPPAAEPIAYPPAPVEEPVTDLAPHTENPFPTWTPPTESITPPPTRSDSGAWDLGSHDTSSAPDADSAWDLSSHELPTEPLADENPFDAFAKMAEEGQSAEASFPATPPPPQPTESPFASFAPPTSEADTYAAPADPRDLVFGGSPPQPDSPVFLEPPVFSETPVFTDTPSAASPTFAPPAPNFASAPPPLVEPSAPDNGVADLYRAAGELPPPVAETPQFAPPSAVEPPSVAVAPIAAPPVGPPPVATASAPFAASAPYAAPGGFDDLLTGSDEPPPPPPSVPWIEPAATLSDPPSDAPPAEPPAPDPDDKPGGRRPFGEGVERDDAVDPSDSSFGVLRAPVSVNTSGIASVAPIVLPPPHSISVITPDDVVRSDAPEAAHRVPENPQPPTIVPAEEAGIEPTPLDQRVGRSARLFWLWFAANSSIAAIVFGTIIFGLGESLRQAIVATLAGVALSFLPLGLGTLAGKRSGQPTMVISRATFGIVGNILPAIVALASRLFWAAALLWILGAGGADILSGARLTGGFTREELTLLVMVAGLVVSVALAYFGYALIAVAQLVISVVSAIAIIGFIALTAKYVDIDAARSVADGPWILVVTGAVVVFSFVGLAWANSSADVARYQRPGSSGAASMLWATFGAALPSFVLIAYGALLAASNSALAKNIASDPLDSLGRLLPVWYPLPLLVATGLSLISGVVLAMYSGGFALQAAGARLRRPHSTLIVGVIVATIAVLLALLVTDYTQLVRDLSTTIAVPIAAWTGIFGAEMVIRNRRFDSHSLLARGGVYEDVRWPNLIALVLVSVIGYGFLSATTPGLGWEGFLYPAFGVPLAGDLARSDLGVLVALGLGILVPAVAGHRAIRVQEGAARPAE